MVSTRTLKALLLPLTVAACWEGPADLDPIFQVDAPPGVRAGDTAVIRVLAEPAGPRVTFRFSSVDGVVESHGRAALFTAPADRRKAVVQVVMSVDGVPSAYQSVTIPIFEQVIILKADDVSHDASGNLPIGWQAFLSYARSADLHVGLGLIGKSLETGSAGYLAEVRELASDPLFEIWNHGYDHVLGATRPDGTRYSEFQGTSVDHQVAHLRRTQQLAREILGVTPRAFGAPGNAIDDNTTRALAQVPELDIWFYGRPADSKLVLPRMMEIEHPLFNPNYDRFVEMYRADLPYLVLQIHPGAWDSGRLAEFTRIVAFLRDRNAAFATPTEFALLDPSLP